MQKSKEKKPPKVILSPKVEAKLSLPKHGVPFEVIFIAHYEKIHELYILDPRRKYSNLTFFEFKGWLASKIMPEPVVASEYRLYKTLELAEENLFSLFASGSIPVGRKKTREELKAIRAEILKKEEQTSQLAKQTEQRKKLAPTYRTALEKVALSFPIIKNYNLYESPFHELVVVAADINMDVEDFKIAAFILLAKTSKLAQEIDSLDDQKLLHEVGDITDEFFATATNGKQVVDYRESGYINARYTVVLGLTTLAIAISACSGIFASNKNNTENTNDNASGLVEGNIGINENDPNNYQIVFTESPQSGDTTIAITRKIQEIGSGEDEIYRSIWLKFESSNPNYATSIIIIVGLQEFELPITENDLIIDAADQITGYKIALTQEQKNLIRNEIKEGRIPEGSNPAEAIEVSINNNGTLLIVTFADNITVEFPISGESVIVKKKIAKTLPTALSPTPEIPATATAVPITEGEIFTNTQVGEVDVNVLRNVTSQIIEELKDRTIIPEGFNEEDLILTVNGSLNSQGEWVWIPTVKINGIENTIYTFFLDASQNVVGVAPINLDKLIEAGFIDGMNDILFEPNFGQSEENNRSGFARIAVQQIHPTSGEVFQAGLSDNPELHTPMFLIFDNGEESLNSFGLLALPESSPSTVTVGIDSQTGGAYILNNIGDPNPTFVMINGEWVEVRVGEEVGGEEIGLESEKTYTWDEEGWRWEEKVQSQEEMAQQQLEQGKLEFNQLHEQQVEQILLAYQQLQNLTPKKRLSHLEQYGWGGTIQPYVGDTEDRYKKFSGDGEIIVPGIQVQATLLGEITFRSLEEDPTAPEDTALYNSIVVELYYPDLDYSTIVPILLLRTQDPLEDPDTLVQLSKWTHTSATDDKEVDLFFKGSQFTDIESLTQLLQENLGQLITIKIQGNTDEYNSNSRQKLISYDLTPGKDQFLDLYLDLGVKTGDNKFISFVAEIDELVRQGQYDEARQKLDDMTQQTLELMRSSSFTLEQLIQLAYSNNFRTPKSDPSLFSPTN